MVEALQAHFGALGDEVQLTAIPGGNKQSAAWCIGQLPPLYAKFRQTNESRYGDEITHLLQCVLKELTKGETACPKAQKLVESIPDRLQLLHEELGLPRLMLKAPRPTPRSRKVR
jgi:hypothetical protein